MSPLFLCTSITLSMARGYSLHIHIVWRLLQPPNTFSWTSSKLRDYTQSSQEIVMAWNILEKKNTRVTRYDSKILPAVIHSKRSGFRPLAENSGAWQASDTCSLTFCNETLDAEAKKEAFSLITNAVNFIQLRVKKTTNNNKTAETFTGSTVQACIESHKWPNKELTNALVYVRTNKTFFNFLIIFFCTETASRPFHNKCTVKSISIHQEGPGGKKKKEKRNLKKVRKTLKDLKSHTGAVLCVPRHRCLF